MSMFFHSLKLPMLYVSAILPLWKITFIALNTYPHSLPEDTPKLTWQIVIKREFQEHSYEQK